MGIKFYGGMFMPDYQAMYAILFGKITSIIEDLQDVQRQMEEMYISSKGPNLRVLGIDEADEDVWKG